MIPQRNQPEMKFNQIDENSILSTVLRLKQIERNSMEMKKDSFVNQKQKVKRFRIKPQPNSEKK